MAPSFLVNNSTRDSSAITYFEIRPEDSNLILRGQHAEASSTVLKGTLVLCLSEPFRIQGIRLRFTGEKRIGFHHASSGPSYVKNHEETLRHLWEFKRNSQILPAGNYEWPFSMIIPGNIQESLEGMTDTWVVYRMKATIERGILQQNVIARKPIRIIRTLNPSDLELSHAMSVDNVWIGKIDYSLSIPSKAVMFGSTVKIDFRLIPLLKGLKIGKIVTELVQKQSLSLKSSRSIYKAHTHSQMVTSDVVELQEGFEAEDVDGRDGYQFTRNLTVPQSLRRCVQDFEGLGIKIRHYLSFNVQLHNPDGHVSELHANLPILVFISPHLPIGEDNTLINSDEQHILHATSQLNDLTPPQYGEHILDQLYDDIDPCTYIGPGGISGFSTPVTPRSRSVSFENFSHLSMTSGDVAAHALRARLNSIDTSGGPAGSHNIARERAQPSISSEGIAERDFSQTGTPPSSASPGTDYFEDRSAGSPAQTPAESISRQSSGEVERQASPQHIEYSVEDLSKVPSYNTAVRSNPRTPISGNLPTYHAATHLSSMSWALNRTSSRVR